MFYIRPLFCSVDYLNHLHEFRFFSADWLGVMLAVAGLDRNSHAPPQRAGSTCANVDARQIKAHIVSVTW